jgi:hypothetical protein
MISFSDLQEVLTKNTKASEFIDDFVKSDNPKFAGKSPAKRKQMALAAYYAKQNEEMIKEDHYVHVNDGSKYDQEPHEKDVEHIMRGVKSHGGENAGLSDKGVVFKFKSKTDAEGFRSHVNKCPHRSCDAHHIDESVNEGVMQPNGTDKVDYDKGMDGNPQNPDKKNKKSRGSDIKILNGEQEPPIKESDTAWATAEEKRREKEKLARISDKDKNTLSKLSALMAKEKKPMKEAMYVEQSRAESGELFKSLVDRAHASSKAGNHTQAKRHLANAQTARYGITSGNMAKHKASFDKYKELKNSYTNSDDPIREMGAVMPSYTKEETLDEISKDTLRSYANKAFAHGNDLHYDLAHSKGDKATDAERAAIKAKLSKRNDGVIKASQKLNREDIDEAAIDHQHRIARDTVKNPNKSLLGGPSAKEAEETLRKKYGYDDKKIAKLKEAVDTVKRDEKGKVIAWSHEGDWEKMSSKKQGQGKAANLAGRALQQTRKLTKEEKDAREYGYEGEMVMTQLKTICRHAEHLMGMLKPDTDLPEWVQSKITLATDYMQTSHDYLMSELDEAVATGPWHVHDSKSGKIHSTYDSHRKAMNAMKKLNGQHDGYETPGGIIQSKYAASAASYHKEDVDLEEKGLWDNIHAKRKRIAAGSGEKMRKPGSKGAPSAQDLKDAQVKEDFELNERTRSAWDISRTADQASKLAKIKGGTSSNEGKEAHYKAGMAHHDAVLAHKSALKRAEASGDHAAAGDHEEAIEHHEAESRKHSNLSESAWGRDKMTSLRQAHDRHMEKALAANKAGDDVAVKTHQRKMQMIQGKMQKLKQNEEVELGEECEILSELSKKTLGSYVKKAALSQHYDNKNFNSKETNNKDTQSNDEKIAGVKKSSKRTMGVMNAVNRLTKEEVEELDELDKKTLGSYAKKSHDQLMKHTSSVNFKQGRGDSDAFAYAHDKEAVRKTANRTKGLTQAINKLTKEEVEDFMQTEEYDQLDELSKDTLKSYVNKSAQNARIQGMMQMDYAHRSKKAKSSGMKNAWDKMSRDAMKTGWKREDGIKTAVNKLTKEEAEQIDELSKDTLKSYVAKAEPQADKLSDKYSTQRMKRDKTHGQFSNDTPELEKLGRKAAKRDDGVFLAKKKLNKEDNMLTYSEFMAQLLEGRADDLKDKLAADREARLNNYDYSKEKAAKKSPVQKVKGHSYGAGEEEGEDDEGSTKTVKPASEKRGRGRPAGSKSGARV